MREEENIVCVPGEKKKEMGFGDQPVSATITGHYNHLPFWKQSDTGDRSLHLFFTFFSFFFPEGHESLVSDLRGSGGVCVEEP